MFILLEYRDLINPEVIEVSRETLPENMSCVTNSRDIFVNDNLIYFTYLSDGPNSKPRIEQYNLLDNVVTTVSMI
jgi:hypothetical protein